ncbi:MAG: hypothetical protein CFE26_03005, partial [Verrucomicrobiales bacterium VVV1]
MKFLVTICGYFLLQGALVAEVARLSWDTKQAAPVQAVGGKAEKLLPAFRLGLSTLRESAVVG